MLIKGHKNKYFVLSLMLIGMSISSCRVGINAPKNEVSNNTASDTIPPNAATSLGWVEVSPSSSTTVTASWTKSNSSDLADQWIQYYADGTCTNPTGSLIDLASSSTQINSFTGVDGVTYSYKILSVDGAGNSTPSVCSALMLITIPASGPPTISSLSPSVSATMGGGTLTINGTTFFGTPTVTINGANCTNVVTVSSTQLTCTFPANAAGSYNVVVTDPDTTNVTSVGTITYTAAPTCPQVATQYFGGGDGLSSGTAYQISSIDGIRAIRYCLGSYYQLTADIDMTTAPNEKLIPGNFTGQFDGQSHILSNLSYDDGAINSGCGLFDNIGSGSVLKNLALNNFTYTNCRNSATGWAGGGLAYRTAAAPAATITMSNIAVNNINITGDIIMGAVVGLAQGASAGVTFTASTIMVNNPTFNCMPGYQCAANVGSLLWGGFAGYVTFGNLNRVGVNNLVSNITGNRMGGLVGALSGATNIVTESFARSEWTFVGAAGNRVGGLFGVISGPGNDTISDCYAEMHTTRLWDSSSALIAEVWGAGVVTMNRVLGSSFTETNTTNGSYFAGIEWLVNGAESFAGSDVYYDNTIAGSCETSYYGCGNVPGTMTATSVAPSYFITPANFPGGTWPLWTFSTTVKPRLAWETLSIP